MAYGITSESQIIDLAAIKSGCNTFKNVLEDFDQCGRLVMKAGETCNSKALSVDDQSLQYPIVELGEAIRALRGEYIGYADEVIASAQRVYIEQKAELAAYQEAQRRAAEAAAAQRAAASGNN